LGRGCLGPGFEARSVVCVLGILEDRLSVLVIGIGIGMKEWARGSSGAASSARAEAKRSVPVYLP
jgi:hypothetical protein